MNKTKRMIVIVGTAVAVAIPAALAMGMQGTTTPPPDNTVEPEMLALMRAGNARRGAEDKLFDNLGMAGDLIIELPAYADGNVPQFDSYWTASQLQAQLGRPLTVDETAILAKLNALPYRIRTVSSRVGQIRAGIAPETPVFEVVGTLNAGRVVLAYLDANALPEMEFGTPTPPTVNP